MGVGAGCGRVICVRVQWNGVRGQEEIGSEMGDV